jgi:hypothetical protein
MSDLFSSLLIFTIIKTILSTFFNVSKFYKNFVKWALTEMECSVAVTTTLDREWCYTCICSTFNSMFMHVLYLHFSTFSFNVGTCVKYSGLSVSESIHFDLSWEFDSLKKNNKRIFHAKTQLPEEFLYDKVLRRNSTFCHNTFVYIIVSYLFVIYKSVVCYLY